MDNALSNLLLISECLLDDQRIDAFESAIRRSVKAGDTVVDSGTGTGILAIFSARSGAKKVYAVEWDREIAEAAKKTVIANNLQHIVEVVNGDIRSFVLPNGGAADVITMEMLDTGLIAEMQADAMVHLKNNGVIGDKTILLPSEAHLYASVVNYDFDFYGFRLPLIIQARNNGALSRIKNVISRSTCFDVIDMSKIGSLNYSMRIAMQATQDGLLNALLLTTDVNLAGFVCPPTSDMNMPVIIPLPMRTVVAGEEIVIDLKYTMSSGFGSLSIG